MIDISMKCVSEGPLYNRLWWCIYVSENWSSLVQVIAAVTKLMQTCSEHDSLKHISMKFNQNINISIHESAFENVFCIMVAI